MSAEVAHREFELFEGYHSVSSIYEGIETLVYRARAQADDAPVILKQTKNEYPSAREVARLRREFVVLRELDLAHTPRALALEERGRGVLLVMADIGHPTLREVLDGRKLDVETALVLAISLSNVLAEVHRRRIIHKDITPRNILVDMSAREVHLIDFGISARISREMKAPSGTGSLEGTLLYMAPEQTGRMNRAVDARADLYGFGAVLYEMLTGTAPFPEQKPEEIVHSHMTRTAVPPYERSSAIPKPLSDIVMTLLAKTPEERYQSDAGLRTDLVECLRQWREGQSIAPFDMRQHDKAPELRRAQRLYGREADVEALLHAFDRARLRGPELVLVTGYSGVGKSALVHEIHKFIARHGGGYFISGKFDKISQDVPLAPVIHALRELVQQILTEPPASLAQWRIDIVGTLAGNAAVLTELVPELALVIGEQPPAPALPPDQAKNRFEMTLQDFLHVFASEKHPLVIFLDDLQWMDPASQQLMQLLLTDSYSQHQLVIGAYRDNEVEAGRPLSSLLDDLEKRGFRSTNVRLGPLDREMVTQLVADTLTSKPEEVSGLAELVYEKTQGNPFFAHQFLVTLNERDLVRFDASAGAWVWDIDAIRGADVTDNVVDLMIGNLRRLSPNAQHVLMRAACIGYSFDFESLQTISERTPAEVARSLFEAMKAGLVLSLDGDYKFLESVPDVAAPSPKLDVRYSFVHDRVLEAAYQLVAPEERQRLHLTIGRLLRARAGGAPRDEDVLDIVHHLNRGAAGITDSAERLDLASLDLRAGRRAKAATAYHAAAEYMRAGIELLREEDWTNHYELCSSLHLDGAQCEGLRAESDRAEALLDRAMKRARSDIERADVLRERVSSLATQAKNKEAIEAACEALSLLGHEVSFEEMMSPAVMMAELAQITENLRGRRILDLVDAPMLADPTARAVMTILGLLGVPAFTLGPVAFSIVNFKSANVSLRYGNTEVSAFPYAAVGYCLATIFNRVSEGMDFGKLADALNKKYPNVVQAGKYGIPYASCMHMHYPIRHPLPIYAIQRQKALEAGDFSFYGSGCFLDLLTALLAGDQLEYVLDNANKFLAILRRFREVAYTPTVIVTRQAIACLAGKTRDHTSLDDEGFNEKEYVAGLNIEQFSNALGHYNVLKTFIYLVHGLHDEALSAAETSEQTVVYLGGNLPGKVHSFLRSMAILAAPDADTPEEAARREEALNKHRGELDFLASNSPQSFGHLKALVDAEVARKNGAIDKAIRLYEEAIKLCQEHKAPHFEAMANERCAKFYLAIGAPTAGGAYMKNAYRAYVHWGATSKAESLVNESQHVWPSLREVSRTRSTTQTGSSQVSHVSKTLIAQTNLGSLRDAALVVRAAQEIASEIDLPKVVDRLTRLVLDNAGADRGALILARDGQLFVEATLGDEGGSIDVGNGKPLDDTDDCAKSIVLYVARTQEHVVLADTRATTKFSDDPRILGGAPKSILCLPSCIRAA
jgi:predicted ATPase/tRNA A-37 threonylcarbamoyl transferase component Bud32